MVYKSLSSFFLLQNFLLLIPLLSFLKCSAPSDVPIYGAISGTVTDSKTGNAIAGAEIITSAAIGILIC